MAAAGYESTERFAAEVLNVDARSARRWKSGERELQGTARAVCVAILARPKTAGELADAVHRLSRLEQADDKTV